MRLWVLLIAIVLVTSATAGCFGRRSGDPSAGTVALSLVPMDAPEGAGEARLVLEIDHIALYDGKTWVPVLTQAAEATLYFGPGLGDPVLLTTIPVPAGAYTDIELVATKGTVSADGGADEEAMVDPVACYAAISIAVKKDATHELQVVLSGPDTLRASTSGWVLRPAVVGSFGSADGAEATLGEPLCSVV